MEVRVPALAKRLVGEILRRFVASSPREEPVGEGELWSVRGVMRQEARVDSSLAEIDQELREVEKNCGFSEPLSMDLRYVESCESPAMPPRRPGPVHVCGRLIIAPPQEDVASDETHAVLRIKADQAFGDGSHPSTRLALRLIDGLFSGEYGQPPEPGWGIDVGCGTGVLALGAAALWAGKVLALDNSEKAIKAAKANKQWNPAWSSNVFLALGELSCCFGPFAVVLANLVPSVQVRVNEDLWAVLEPGGWLILSGFCEAQQELISSRYPRKGTEEKACLLDQGWVGLLLQKVDPRVA
jgi:ribosomal protein L11 methylase PrmA